MTKPLLPLIFLLCISCLHAQESLNRVKQWYFGYKSGINFIDSLPVASTNGQLESIEGSAVIADTSGQLLYYTNGEQLWNRAHNLAYNGNGLMGNQSYIQTALFIPMPGKSERYYLFTAGMSGLHYSIIDNTLDGGLGGIPENEKNILLNSSQGEGLSAVQHCNGRDYWLVNRIFEGSTAYIQVYLIDEIGLTPVTTYQLPPETIDNNRCHFTFSMDASLLAYSSFDSNVIIYEFYPSHGGLNPIIEIPVTNIGQLTYSTAFSPDHSKLYTTGWGNGVSYLEQYNLEEENVWASRTTLHTVDYSNGSPNGFGFLGRLQLGPDQNIYMSRWHQNDPFEVNPNTYYSLDSLDVILKPNLAGELCEFVKSGIYLEGQPTQIGLPNFVDSFLNPNPDSAEAGNIEGALIAETGCVGDTIPFHIVLDTVPIGEFPVISWDFAGLGGANGDTVYFVFPASGMYEISADVYYPDRCMSGYFSMNIEISPLPEVNLPAVVHICEDDSLLLETPVGYYSYLWSTGDTLSNIWLSEEGSYSVTVSDGICIASDVVTLIVDTEPLFSLGPDISFCLEQEVLLDAVLAEGEGWLWSTGDTTSQLAVNEPGIYTVEIGVGACTVRDTIQLEWLDNTIGDTLQLAGNQLIAPAGFDRYYWSRNGQLIAATDDSFLNITEYGIYSVLIDLPNACQAELTLGIAVTACEHLFVYPNPATSRFYVPTLTKSVEAYSSSGQLVKKWASTETIDGAFVLPDALPSGVYFLIIRTAECDRMQKLVVIQE
ncbi:MAG: T9SS type A sorting domain-containing protein [Chitinophagales bacterium]|nr:T9SS type A sorting domain-containing protein [Chitinophagales bacterium]